MTKRATTGKRQKIAKRKPRESDLLRMSAVKLAYPANNYPTSVSDEDIKVAVREYYEKNFRKSSGQKV
jgi:hypothetical protein